MVPKTSDNTMLSRGRGRMGRLGATAGSTIRTVWSSSACVTWASLRRDCSRVYSSRIHAGLALQPSDANLFLGQMLEGRRETTGDAVERDNLISQSFEVRFGDAT